MNRYSLLYNDKYSYLVFISIRQYFKPVFDYFYIFNIYKTYNLIVKEKRVINTKQICLRFLKNLFSSGRKEFCKETLYSCRKGEKLCNDVMWKNEAKNSWRQSDSPKVTKHWEVFVVADFSCRFYNGWPSDFVSIWAIARVYEYYNCLVYKFLNKHKTIFL